MDIGDSREKLRLYLDTGTLTADDKRAPWLGKD